MNDAMQCHFILLEVSVSTKNKTYFCFFETAAQLAVSKIGNLTARCKFLSIFGGALSTYNLLKFMNILRM
jgi:hypothetical protein